MSDIFISYASATLADARKIAEALRSLGYSVWSDEQIPAHRAYAAVIDERLDGAKAVVVIWSAAAVISEWVQSEADSARTEGKLVQVNIDGSRLPRPFDRIQCINLSEWDGDPDAAAWQRVVASVANLTGVAPVGQRRKAPVRDGAEAPPAPKLVLDDERKTVTVLFADIKQWLDSQDTIDPEDALAITEPILTLMTGSVKRHGGHIVRHTEDGILAMFGAPVAREDHPLQALHAALEIRADLHQHWPGLGVALAPADVRVGVSTGEVVVRMTRSASGHELYAPSGPVANLAFRLQSSADASATLVSALTAKLARGYFELRQLEDDAFELIGLGGQRSRLQHSAGLGFTAFVGRGREIEAMASTAARAKAGRGQSIAVMAEPGMGKSRLMMEFKAAHAEGWTVMETSAVSHGKSSAYLPMIALLNDHLGIAASDPADVRRAKIANRVTALDPALAPIVPFLCSLLEVPHRPDPLADLSAQERRRRTHDAIKHLLLYESLVRPLMVIVEDLHWIDDATQEVLDLVVGSVGAARLLVVVNFRPEYSDAWSGRTYHNSLTLDGLADNGADAMISSLLGDGPEMEPLKKLIIERTEGNPLFMEEMVLTLLDEGVLVRGETLRLARPLGGLRMPPTVQAILAARIDRLPSELKALLQTLSVIGRRFSLVLATLVTGISEAELVTMLSALEREEFIYEKPTFGSVEYTFKHALTQDVAYSSLLNERRRALHMKTAETMEAMVTGGASEHAAELSNVNMLLAHHLEKAGERSRAAEYLRLESARVFAFGLVEQAVEIGLRAARLAGADLPADPNDIESAIGAEFGQITTLLAGREAAELANLPPLDDPLVGQRILLLLLTAPFAHQGKRLDLFTLLVCTALRHTLQHGQGPLTPDVFAMYSIVSAAVTGDHTSAAAWSKMGLGLLGDGNEAAFSRCAFMHGWFHNHWVAPLEAGIALVDVGAEAGLANDELLYGCFNLAAGLVFEAAAGHPLSKLITSARVRAEKNGGRVKNAHYHLILELQFAKAMAGLTADIRCLGDDEIDEAKEIDSIVTSDLSNQIGYYLVTKTKVSVHAGDWDDALLWAARAAPVMPYCGGQTAEFELVQYRGLAALALAAFTAADNKAVMMEEGRTCITQLQGWSQLNPGLFAHKAQLLEGVSMVAEGRIADAERLLEQARSAAESGGFLHDGGLAAEYLARARRVAGELAGAQRAAIAAREIYGRWGADAKAALMTQEFGLVDG